MMMASFVALVEVCKYLLHVIIFRNRLIMLCYSVYSFLFILSSVSGWSLKSTGAFVAVSRYASATMLPPSILSRGIGWQVTQLHLKL